MCRAFRTFRHLTDADAIRLAANAQGILLRQLGGDEARAVQQALRAEGVNVALVREADLHFLPESQVLHRIEFTPDALMVFDVVGRPHPLPWNEIRLIAAGAVPHVEISSIQTPRRELKFHPLFGVWPKQVVDTRSRLATEHHFLLELIGGPRRTRYEIQAREFPFNYVLDQPLESLTEKFVWLVRELTRRAPQALLNRAAQDVRDGVTLVRGYPSRQMLLDEMIWLLWNAAQQEERPTDWRAICALLRATAAVSISRCVPSSRKSPPRKPPNRSRSDFRTSAASCSCAAPGLSRRRRAIPSSPRIRF